MRALDRSNHPEDRHPVFDQLDLLLRNRTAVAGFLIVAGFIATAILAPVLSPHDPLDASLYDQLKPPVWYESGTWSHILGTDDLGRDILSRILYGARVSLAVGVVSVGIGLLFGSGLGAVAGYYRGWRDSLVMRAMDMVLAFPHVLLAIIMVAYLGPSLRNAMIAIGIIYIPRYARIVRASVMEESEKDYVAAARSIGCGTFSWKFSPIASGL